jgi:hypothetical protein
MLQRMHQEGHYLLVLHKFEDLHSHTAEFGVGIADELQRGFPHPGGAMFGQRLSHPSRNVPFLLLQMLQQGFEHRRIRQNIQDHDSIQVHVDRVTLECGQQEGQYPGIVLSCEDSCRLPSHGWIRI